MQAQTENCNRVCFLRPCQIMYHLYIRTNRKMLINIKRVVHLHAAFISRGNFVIAELVTVGIAQTAAAVGHCEHIIWAIPGISLNAETKAPGLLNLVNITALLAPARKHNRIVGEILVKAHPIAASGLTVFGGIFQLFLIGAVILDMKTIGTLSPHELRHKGDLGN